MKCFVSRSSQAWQPTIAALNAPFLEWHCQSLIETSALPFVMPEQSFDWIFFSSREGVKFFSDRFPVLPTVQIAAIGEATATEISAFSPVHFVGASNNTNMVAETFAQKVGTSNVLFPVSEQSVRTIQRALPKKQVIEVMCYRTLPVAIQLPPFELYIFSSPSNVISFFETNTIAQGASILAFGQRSAKQLADFGCSKIYIADQLSPSSLADTIKQICTR